MSEKSEISKVEAIKRASQYLRGEIAEELVDENDQFSKASIQILKHHGTYQQDDRDLRSPSGKSYMMMVRTKIPGGILTHEQLLAELDIADELGNGTLRITSRQALQHHGILKRDLKTVIRRLHEVERSTLGACGDVQRNVMCCPAPYTNAVSSEIRQLTQTLAEHFAPRSPAYHQLWIQDPETYEKQEVDRAASADEFEVEPLYGKSYLPRKFKTAVGLPYDNCIDLHTHDLGLLAVIRDQQIVGYNVLVGGGQAVTPALKKTFPALSKPLAFVERESAVAIAEAVVKVQRDFGNRADRKVARLKYLIHDWGLEAFKAKVEQYYGRPLAVPEPDDVYGFNDHMGWDQQGDGRWFYGLNVENGRIKDEGASRLKSALREICLRLKPGIRLTSHQSLLLTDLTAADRTVIESMLDEYGVKRSEEISQARRWSMACVAWPTCGLSITESERALPKVIDDLEVELARQGLSAEKFTIRMTGCPNGCARPYNCDIGLVGKAKDRYTLFLGGRLLGDRLNFLYRDLVPVDQIVATLAPLFAFFKLERLPDESFGDFCHRQGHEALRNCAESSASNLSR